MKFKSVCLIVIVIIASCAIVSASNTISSGGNNEGVNATVFGIFNVQGDIATYVDIFIDENASVSSQVKIVDTDGVIHEVSGSGMNELGGDKYIPVGAGRYICPYYPENPIKIKYATVESTVRGEYARYNKELTPFLINLSEVPSITFPSVEDSYAVYSLNYSLNATSNTTIHNISIIPYRFYQIAYKNDGDIRWVLGMRLENIGANPQSIKPSDFKFEDQYGWKYEANMWSPYNFNEEGSTFFNYDLAHPTDSDKNPINILPGEMLRVALRFGEVSMLSIPSALEYMNGSIKMGNVTSKIVPGPE